MRITLACLAVLAVAGPVGASEGSSAALSLKLTVREPAGVARKCEPACGGVPLPWGVYRKDQAFAVFEGGREIPAQVLPLVVDQRGYLRWVLVDVQTDVPAGGRKSFTLRAVKPSAKPSRPLGVKQGPDGVTVDTGRIKFAISKSKPFSLFTSVRKNGTQYTSGGSASYTDCSVDQEKGRTYTAGEPASIEVTDAGPMRATIKVTGYFLGDQQTKMRYIARITAWAGQSRVYVKYSLANSNPDHYCMRMIGASSISLKLAGKPSGTPIGGEKARAGGWIAAPTNNGVAYACDTFFRENPPRALEVEDGHLVLQGIAGRGKPIRGVFLLDSSHHSSHYVLDFAATANATELMARSRADQQRLHVLAPSSWYADTEGLAAGKFGSQADEMKCYDLWKWKYDPRQAPRKRGYKLPKGRYMRGEHNHYETEQDNVESLLLMYLRTGKRDFLTACRTWANHSMDLQLHRTDGWRFKDGACWWNRGGPSGGNRPQRKVDPVTGIRNYWPVAWAKRHKKARVDWDNTVCREIHRQAVCKQCYCHNYGAGLVGYFCITGNRDALEAALDSVEQNYDGQRRSFGRVPGKPGKFNRDFSRGFYQTNALRLAMPGDKFVEEASDYLAALFLERPNPDPRGMVGLQGYKLTPKLISTHTGGKGAAALAEAGVKVVDDYFLVDIKTGARWKPLVTPATWVFPPISRAMEVYWRLKRDEEAHDWVVAFGQSAARVMHQPYGLHARHCLVDFPRKGVHKDCVAWRLPEGDKWGEGHKISGYLSRFWPDVPARAYGMTGEKLLKQRAYDFWNGGSHRGYHATKMSRMNGVYMWVQCTGPHTETVCFTGRTFYEWSRPRKDERPPKAVSDLKALIAGDRATVTFTAPADEGGGRVVRYQVKCSDKPIVDYATFLDHWKKGTDGTVTNWWMAANLKGEPGSGEQGRTAPKAPGAGETLALTGVPARARYFAVRAYDDSSNRSAISNVTEAE
jgi:hypothetical protein